MLTMLYGKDIDNFFGVCWHVNNTIVSRSKGKLPFMMPISGFPSKGLFYKSSIFLRIP